MGGFSPLIFKDEYQQCDHLKGRQQERGGYAKHIVSHIFTYISWPTDLVS